MTKIAKIILSVSIAVLVVATSVTIVIVSTNKKHEQDSDSSHVHAFTEQKAEEKYLATPASCTEKAKYYYSCACGENGSNTFENGDALGHSFTNYASDNNATCTQDGTKTAKCDRCEEVNTVADEGSKLEHNFDKQVVADKYLAFAATCTEKAKYYYSCACGEKGSNTFENGNALGHNFGEWETVTEPTETKKGLKKRVCVRTGCGYSESKEIPELSHEHSYTEKEVDERYLASAATCTKSATYYYSCACGVKGTATFENGSALGHNFGAWVTVKEPTEEEKGLKTRTCVRTGCGYSENAEIPELTHAHSFTREYADDYYLATPATCTEPAKYYYSCACGEKSTETFTSGNPNGHTYSEKWTYNATEHWHAATCGHNVEKDRAKHKFDENKKCTVCDYVTTKPLGLELQSSVFDVDLKTKTAYLKVANAATDYDFSDKFTVADGARFDVCTDKQCNNKIASKKTDIVAGDNVFYILITNGNDVASYTVTLRRRPIYTITFNANGGTAVEKQQVEEDDFAVETTTTRKGYTFSEWDYDFSTPILKNETITASWNIITYNINYVLNGGENAENNPTTYTIEDEITLPAPTKTGYIGNWNNGGKIEKGSIGDKTFTASYTVDQFNVVVKPSIDDICSFTDKSGVYSYNTSIYLEISDIYLGYEFVGWYNGEMLLSTDNEYTLNVPANDITITAKLSVKEEMQNYNFTSTTNSCKITSIKDKTITNAVIPDYVTSIGERAFYGF